MKFHALNILLCALLCGCVNGDPKISAQIGDLFQADHAAPINLAQVGPSSWEKLCVLKPYTTNQVAEEVLGFKWDAEGKTSIAASDGINVLVFVRRQEVVAYTEHPRNKGDFSKLQPPCLPRAEATVVREKSDDGWVFLVATPGITIRSSGRQKRSF